MYILYDHDNTVCAWVVYQVVGFFDVAARLCASDKPIAAVAPPEGEASPLWVDVQKLCNMCVLSLSWNFFVSHRTNSLCTAVNVSASGGLRTLDPL